MAAYEPYRGAKDILLPEKGTELAERKCPSPGRRSFGRSPCHIMTGLRRRRLSDGKYDKHRIRRLADRRSSRTVMELIERADSIL